MTTALTAAESALAAIMKRADAALAVMRQEAQDAAARLKAARLEVARIKAERLSVEQGMAEAAAGFETLAAELSDAFPAPTQTQTPEEAEYEFLTGEKLTPEPIELTEEHVAPECRCAECGAVIAPVDSVGDSDVVTCLPCFEDRKRQIAEAAREQEESRSVAAELAHWAGEDVTSAANGPSPGPLTAAALKAAAPATNGRRKRKPR